MLANATVLTALLVYFGWQRSEVQASQLGIDESILGMSTRDYVLRSVRPVLVLVLLIGVGGLLWLRVDNWLDRRLRARAWADPVVRLALRLLPFAWIALPAAVWALGYLWRATAFIAWPFSIGAGLLLALYAAHLRQLLPDADPYDAGRQTLLRAFTAIVVGVTLFWGASNYATVLGDSLARDFLVPGRPAGPRVLTGSKSAYQYRYTGLRLLEHTGGHYFLISDGWSGPVRGRDRARRR